MSAEPVDTFGIYLGDRYFIGGMLFEEETSENAHARSYFEHGRVGVVIES